MRVVRPGPERDAAIRRMRERWAADEAALSAAPFPIFGLTPPFPAPISVGSFETVNGLVRSVGLQYGAPGPPPAPLVTVSTEAADDRGPSAVADVLRDLAPPGEGDPEAAELLIDGAPHGIRVLDSEPAWAAVVELSSNDVALLVTIAARDWPRADVALARVTDLEPFFAGRRQRVEAALARAGSRPGPRDWNLPRASGLVGHRALADMMIAATRGSTLTSALPNDYAQRWEIATRAQMELARQDRDEAEDAIHSVINHLCQLVQSANWFSDSNVADEATAETLDYVAYGRDVRSAEAQRAWSAYWGLHGQQPLAFESLSATKEAWLAAWQRWVDTRQIR